MWMGARWERERARVCDVMSSGLVISPPVSGIRISRFRQFLVFTVVRQSAHFHTSPMHFLLSAKHLVHDKCLVL
jgi:hypothetical protein